MSLIFRGASGGGRLQEWPEGIPARQQQVLESSQGLMLASSMAASPTARAGVAASSSRAASSVRPSPASAIARYRALVNGVSSAPGEESAAVKCSGASSGSAGRRCAEAGPR